jgi:hypothetical protein
LPQALEELRAGTIHLTGLFLLSTHLTEQNAGALLAEARGKSRRQIEELIALRFPRPDVPPRIEPVVTPARAPAPLEQPSLPGAQPGHASEGARSETTCPGAGNSRSPTRLEPLSPSRYRVEFTARTELRNKLERARELLSHAVPSGDLGELVERALDALIEKETRKRFGAGRPRKQRELKGGSRHIPVEIARAVWERDQGQCAFVDAEGRRCSERRFLTLEHRQPFALGGPPTLENICLLCASHNLQRARVVFGEPHVEQKIRASERDRKEQPVSAHATVATRSLDADTKVLSVLCQLGFPRRNATGAIGRVCASEPDLKVEQLLRKSLLWLVPASS